MDQVESHKIQPPPASEVCEGAVGAGIMLSKLNGSKGTVGAETYANRSCVALPAFASVDEVLAADKSLLDANKPPLQAFALPAQNDRTVQDRQIRDSISGLEDQLGYKLNYCWFDDDSGKAQVFLLGKAEKETESHAPVASCVAFENLVDDSANLQMNIPPGTPEGEAGKIWNEREHRADLAKEGIPVDAPEAEVKAIESDRVEQIKSLQSLPTENMSDDELSARYLRESAIELGLSADSSAEQIKQIRNDYALQARAIKLGLDQRASADDVKATETRIESTPDFGLNAELGLPANTTRADALNESMKWLNDSHLVSQGYDPDMTLDQRLAVAQDRTKVISGYQNAIDSGTLSEEAQQSAKLSISAVQIGLPPDSTAQTISETTDLYSHQARSVALGLPRDASEQAIKDAQERSDEPFRGDVAKNMCVDK